MSKKSMKTPAKRAMDWAKRHGRPMDATVIKGWEAGWNAACRFKDGWARSTASPQAFALNEQLIHAERENKALRALLLRWANAAGKAEHEQGFTTTELHHCWTDTMKVVGT